MTLEEAIKHEEEIAALYEIDTDWDMGDYFIDKSEVASIIKCGKEHRQLAEWLKELKQLREQTRWVPVSERLPKNCMRVLITLRRYNGEVVVRSGYYYDHGDGSIFETDNGNVWCIDEEGLIAWQPLPKPYESQESEE